MRKQRWEQPGHRCDACGVPVSDEDQTYCAACKPKKQRECIDEIKRCFDPGDHVYDVVQVMEGIEELRVALRDWHRQNERPVALSQAVRR